MKDSPLSLYFRNGYKGAQKPIIIKLYIPGAVRSEVSTGVRVEPSQWDEIGQMVKDHPQAARLNKIIAEKVAEQQKKIDARKALDIPLTRDIIKKPLSSGLREFAQSVYKDKKICHTQLVRLEAFNKAPVKLPLITQQFLREYTTFLQVDFAKSTTAFALEWLQGIINLAIIDKKLLSSPFVGFNIPKRGKSDPEWLLDSERLEFEKLLDTYDYDQKSSEYAVLVWFLIACYTGLRESDWGKIDLENRLYQVNGEWLFRVKAKKNGNWVIMAVGDTLYKLLMRSRGLVLPTSNCAINTNIKKLIARINKKATVKFTKHITSHDGRHTFGFRCACEGMSPHLLAELLGVGIRTVQVYYHLSGEQVTKQTRILATW